MKKILGVIGSPRKGGNTEILVKACLESAGEYGATVRIFHLAEKEVNFCLACAECPYSEEELCRQDDDMHEAYELMQWSEGIVFGTPVYMGTVSGQLKAFMDRTRPLWNLDNALGNKVGAAIAVGEGRWGGQELALETIRTFCLNHGMILVGQPSLIYENWEVCGVAAEPGEIVKDEEALLWAKELGRRLAEIQVKS